MENKIISPCISICRTDPVTGYCYGCARTNEEKKQWKDENSTNKWKEDFQLPVILISDWLNCHTNPGNNINAVACNLQAAFVIPATPSIISKTAPALETANNATPIISHA